MKYIPIDFETLKKAAETICPDRIAFIESRLKEFEKNRSWFGTQTEEHKSRFLIEEMFQRLIDGSNWTTDDICRFVCTYRSQIQNEVRGYNLIFRLFFAGFIPVIEFKRCFYGAIDENKDVPHGYESCTTFIDSNADEIDLSLVEPISTAGMGAGEEKALGIDMSRMASSIFEKMVWPRIWLKNHDKENSNG